MSLKKKKVFKELLESQDSLVVKSRASDVRLPGFKSQSSKIKLFGFIEEIKDKIETNFLKYFIKTFPELAF